jgi:hypothetical protein
MQLLRPGLCGAGGRLGSQCVHEGLTQGGLDVVRFVRNRGGQIGLQDFRDLWKHFALIALRISLLHPQGDGDHLFILGLGKEGQDLQESSLLLQDGKNLVANCLYQFLFLFRPRDEFNNTGKHGILLSDSIGERPGSCSVLVAEYLTSQYHRHHRRLTKRQKQ